MHTHTNLTWSSNNLIFRDNLSVGLCQVYLHSMQGAGTPLHIMTCTRHHVNGTQHQAQFLNPSCFAFLSQFIPRLQASINFLV